MKPSEICKKNGLTLKRVAELAGTSEQNLINWHKSKPKMFALIVSGAKEEQKKCQSRGVD